MQAPATQTGADGTAVAAPGGMLVTDKHGDAAGEAKGRPVIVYFFWPPEKNEKGAFLDKRGEATKKIEDKVFGQGSGDDMEKLARIAKDFHTIKINAKTADIELMKSYKVDPAMVPCFRITSPEGKVVASVNGAKMSANDLKKELENALKKSFPEYNKELEAKLKDTAKIFDEAKAAMKKDTKEDLAVAVAKFQEVMNAIPRGDNLDLAATNMDLCQKKLKKMQEDAQKEAAKNTKK